MSNFCINTLLRHIDKVFEDTNHVPQIVSVSLPVYRDLLIEAGQDTIYDYPSLNTSLIRKLEIYSSFGPVKVVMDKDMPVGMDFYFDDGKEEKMRWLDQLAEEILLRGEG